MSAIPAPIRLATPWRPALWSALAALAIVLLVYRETALAIVGIWQRSETFAHGFLVVPIALWLVWRLRHRLAVLAPRPQPWFLLPMAGAAALWLVADLVVVNAAAQFAFVAMLVLIVPTLLGVRVAHAMLFPLLFLFFGVPFGEFMLPTMMEWTADFVVLALRLTGIPVYREGLQFVIPSGTWSVIDECSGVRYLIASFMVGSLFAYLNYRSTRKRLVFMGVSILMPVLANWLRAYIIVMLGHLSGNKIATGVDHIIYGWVFFGFVIFIMFTIGARWSESDPQGIAGDGSAAALPHAGVGPRSMAPMASIAATLLAGTAIVLLPHLLVWGLERSEHGAAEPRLALPGRLQQWSADGAQIVPWSPSFANPSVAAARAYTAAAGTVGVHIAYYRGQHDERKLVSSHSSVVGLNDRIWNRVASGTQPVQTASGAVTLRTMEILGPKAGAPRRPQLVVWYAYWIDGRLITSEALVKLANARARLRGRGDDGAALVLYADEPTVAASNAALEAFTKVNLEALTDLLRQTRDSR